MVVGNQTFTNRTVYQLNYTIPGSALTDGQTYYVSVQATGNGGTANATSAGVQVSPCKEDHL